MIQIYRKAKATYLALNRKSVFSQIYNRGAWGSGESRSGSGSSMEATIRLRGQLPLLIKEFGIRSILDAPCGDFHWMRGVEIEALADYTGIDIVPEVIDHNTRLFGSERVRFRMLDVVQRVPPRADLILCRHLLIHLPLKHCLAVIKNFKRSYSSYLLITTQPAVPKNEEIVFTGSYRGLNLDLPPFGFPKPIKIIDDSQHPSDSAELRLYHLNQIL